MTTYLMVLFMALLALISIAIQMSRVSYQNTKLELTVNAQAKNAARAGLVDALSWFRRQPGQPVSCSDPNLYPDYAFKPLALMGDTLDEKIGLVKEYRISNDKPLWLRYEVRRAQSQYDMNMDAARDITDKRKEGGVRGSGLVWSVTSAGYVFRKKDPAVPFNAAPNEIKAKSIISTQFRRLGLNVGAALTVRSLQTAGGGPTTVTLKNSARIISKKAGVAALNWYSGTAVSPTYLGSANDATSIIGTKAKLTPSSPDYLDPRNVFGVSKEEFKLIADVSATNFPNDFPALYPDMAIVFIEGDAAFSASRPLRGGGILYVTGNLTIPANSNALFSGLIFVEGNLSISPPASLSGAVLVGGTDVYMDGTADASEISYDENILSDIRQQIAQYREDRSSYFADLDRSDRIPPEISAVAVSNVTSNGGTISWETNELADSQIEYGLSTSYGSVTPVVCVLVASHSYGLYSVLAPNTLYHFRVKSRDASGNLAVSGDYGFTTAGPDTTGPVISGVNHVPTSDGAAVSWTTDEVSGTEVQYGLTTAYGPWEGTPSTLVTSHLHTITGLSGNTLYNYRVRSIDSAGNATLDPTNRQFTTLPDVSPPVVSGVNISGITSNSAVVTWNTDEPADSQASYGATPAYGSFSALDATMVTFHTRAMTGLLPNTLYFCRVLSTDAAAPPNAVSFPQDDSLTFTTLPDNTPPVISGVAISDYSPGTNTGPPPTAKTTFFEWATDEPADSWVDYGKTLGYGNTVSDGALTLTHSLVIDNLDLNFPYHYRIKTKDSGGNQTTSGDYLFTTPGSFVTPGTWSPTSNSMSVARSAHTATLLNNGKVLVAGGWDGATSLASADLYDPATQTWSAAGNMNFAKDSQPAAVLNDGRVLVPGGRSGDINGWTELGATDIYDPATQTWKPWLFTEDMYYHRSNHTATLLNNGKVLAAGGVSLMTFISWAELYNPASQTWSTTGSMAQTRAYHTATLLNNGKVLVAGGYGTTFLSTAELYDPVSLTWSTTGSMSQARDYHTATLLNDGKVLVAGGRPDAATYLSTAEFYEPSTLTWTPTGPMSTARGFHAATLLNDGRVLVTGGTNGTTYLSSAEIYNPTTNTWSTTGFMSQKRGQHTATLLGNGKVLVAGGTPDDVSFLSTAEIYNP